MTPARLPIVAACLALALAAGCAQFYAEQADREVYGILGTKNALALGRVREFSIKPCADPAELLKGCAPAPAEAAAAPEGPAGAPAAAPGSAPAVEGAAAPAAGAAGPVGPPAGAGPVPQAAAEAAGPAGEEEALPPALPALPRGTVRLGVADALRVAVRASREYQAEKETVYLAALTLTFERYLFQPHPTLTGTVRFEDNDANNLRERDWDNQAGLGVSQQLADGLQVVGSLGLVALKFLDEELADAVDSTLSVTFRQPLWRGVGREVVQENLVQAERNALYAVRTFARFEQTFAIQIASQYLRVLQQRDVVLNEHENYRSLRENRARAEWMAKAELQAEFQVDQARQDELRARNRWIVAQEDYANALDTFKILLGLPVTCDITLDAGELDRLTSLGLRHSETRLEEAVAKALVTRFDLSNARGGVDDARRKVKVAENGLAGQVDLVASIGYGSRGDAPQSARLSFHRGDYAIGLDIDLPIDRLTERNALRRTQIQQEQARRAVERLQDDVMLQVRAAFRRLEQARQSYDIQKRSVELADRRVESTQLLLQAGRASQRDVLEAQRALVEARNGLTGALVSHTIAGLEFQRDVGTLLVDEEGQIHGWDLTDGGR